MIKYEKEFTLKKTLITILYTVVFNTVIGIILTALFKPFWHNFVYSQCIGILICICVLTLYHFIKTENLFIRLLGNLTALLIGFDEFFGIAGSLDMIPYVFYQNRLPYREVTEMQTGLPFPRFIREGPRAKNFDPGRALDDLTEQAVSYINTHASEEHPFFLYFALTAPHKPVWPAGRFSGKLF